MIVDKGWGRQQTVDFVTSAGNSGGRLW